jgi:magnesium chelatase family protein
MNLCPCGARGDPGAHCNCTPDRVHRYREKLSRALLDRFDLVLTVPRPRGVDLAGPPGETSDVVRDRVVDARRRLGEFPPPLRGDAEDLLTRAVERLPLSGRGRTRVARVAATIAALSASAEVAPEHLAEALSYRPPRELTD